MIRRILVPTDLSDLGTAALRWAAMFHERAGAAITLLYADRPYVADGVDVPGMVESSPEPMTRRPAWESLSHRPADA